MLEGGEEPLFIARRLVRTAMEDIGSADPMSLVLANAAREAYEHLGSPEGELALAQLTLHLACAPKSNAVYSAFSRARKAARETGSLPPPAHILNAPTRLMKSLGYGEGYVYDHDAEGGFSGQDYFPEGMGRRTFYEPRGEGSEARVRERLERWAGMRAKRQGGGRP
jgi:putative ATPase